MIKYLKKQFKEKRKTQRLNIPIQVKYRLLPKKRILEETFTQDISGGGIRLRLSSPLKEGDTLKILLHFPHDPIPIAAFTKVIRCTKKPIKGKVYFDVGMQYLKINTKDRERFVFRFCEMMINYFILGQRRW